MGDGSQNAAFLKMFHHSECVEWLHHGWLGGCGGFVVAVGRAARKAQHKTYPANCVYYQLHNGLFFGVKGKDYVDTDALFAGLR